MNGGARPTPLAPAFARRMAPLSVLVGLVVGVALPMAWQRVQAAQRHSEATVWAHQLAEGLERVARSRPRLWAYDAYAVSEVAGPLLAQPVPAEVRVDAAGRDGAYAAGSVVGDAAVGWSVVRVDGRAAGRVRVRLGHDEGGAAKFFGIAGVAGLLLAAGLFWLPLATVRRGDVRDAALWDALEAANAHLEARVVARTAELRRLGARLVEVQEEERARLSRDLHDELGQTLTGLRLRLTALETTGLDSPHLRAALASVDEGVAQVRGIARNLRPPALDALGLAAALRDHAERWASQAGLALVADVEDIAPPAAVAEVLFRVGQEALTNVARHAEASRVRLELRAADDGWRLVVEDDGGGLSGEVGGGLGLVGARERVTQVGGYLDLEAGEWGGLRLTAWVPGEL